MKLTQKTRTPLFTVDLRGLFTVDLHDLFTVDLHDP
jgi:hypothetical protein